MRIFKCLPTIIRYSRTTHAFTCNFTLHAWCEMMCAHDPMNLCSIKKEFTKWKFKDSWFPLLTGHMYFFKSAIAFVRMSICMPWSRSHSIFVGFLQELWWVQLGLVFDEDKCFLLATAIQVTHPQGPKSFSPGRMVKLILGYSISILNGYIIRMEVYVRTLRMKLHFILAVIVICVTLSSLLFVVDFFNLRASPHSKHFDTSFSLIMKC